MNIHSLPRTLASLPGVRHLPWPGPLALIPATLERGAAEAAVNRALAPQLADGDVDFLDGRRLRIRILDLGCDWLVTKTASRLSVRAGRDGAEVTFAGDARSLLLLAARREDPDTLFFQRRLVIEGDTELGLQVKNLIDSVDFDELRNAGPRYWWATPVPTGDGGPRGADAPRNRGRRGRRG